MIKTNMFEHLFRALKMDGIQISLFGVACLTSMQNVVVRKCGKMITHCFLVKKIIFG
jgi:hypothetical protein